jgi:hypothetical protein
MYLTQFVVASAAGNWFDMLDTLAEARAVAARCPGLRVEKWIYFVNEEGTHTLANKTRFSS